MPPTRPGHDRPKSVHDVLGLFRLTTVHDMLDPDTYEIGTAPQVLNALGLNGKIITGDAILPSATCRC
jgi:hypothetical protein